MTALDSGDRTAFRAALTDDAAMSDDGAERDLEDGTEREIFSSQGDLATDSLESVAEGRPVVRDDLLQRHLGRQAHPLAL